MIIDAAFTASAAEVDAGLAPNPTPWATKVIDNFFADGEAGPLITGPQKVLAPQGNLRRFLYPHPLFDNNIFYSILLFSCNQRREINAMNF